MDYKKIIDTKVEISNLKSRLKELENATLETIEKINEVQNNCSHEMIFIYRKYENRAYEYLQYGKCLVCGKTIALTPDNVNSDTNELILEEKIIDVVAKEVEQWSHECDCNKNAEELREAERVFNSITNDADYLYSRDCIKTEIIESVKAIKGTTKKK